MNMIERVAIAILRQEDINDGAPEGHMTLHVLDDAIMATARAAIEAMREPTEVMKNAADLAMTDVFYWNYEVKDESDSGAVIYSAMIDAALREASDDR